MPRSKIQLLRYSTLATATLAMTNQAEGQTIYTDIDPDILLTAPAGGNENFSIDFNTDGIDDILFSADDIYSEGANLRADPLGLNQVDAPFLFTLYCGYASGKLAGNTPVGSDIDFTFDFTNKNGWLKCGIFTQFPVETEGVLGAQLDISGNTHYGWVRVEVIAANAFKILDYAYNATPAAPIVAGAIPTPVCSAPASIYVDSLSSHFVRVKWDEIAVATEYQIQARRSGSSNIFSTFKSLSKIQRGGLPASTGFEIRVRGVCPTGLSDWTPWLAFSTPMARIGEAAKLRLYPNPAGDKVIIEGTSTTTRIVISNMLGARVLEIKGEQGLSEINTSSLVEGLYFIQLLDGEHSRTLQLIVGEM